MPGEGAVGDLHRGALVDDPADLAHEAAEQPVHDEGRAVLDQDRGLLQRLAGGERRRQRGVVGGSPVTISSSGITATGLKKWKPTTRSGCSRSAAISVIDSDEVLVAQHALGGDDLLDVGEDGLLDRHLLEDGLDHEVGVAERDLLVGRAGHQRLVAVGLVLVDPALGEELVDLGVHVGHALVGPLLVEVGEHDRHLEAAYEEQRELAGHQAGTHDADLGHRPGEGLVGRTGRALGTLLHEVEGVERGEQLGRLRQRVEGVVLGGEAGVAVGVAGRGDQLDGLLRGG